MYGVKAAQTKAPSVGVLLWSNDPNMQKITNQYMTEAGYPLLKTYSATVAKPDSDMQYCDPYGVQVEQSIDVQSSHAISPASPHLLLRGRELYRCGVDQRAAVDGRPAQGLHHLDVLRRGLRPGTTQGSHGCLGRTVAAGRTHRHEHLRLQRRLTGISTFAASGDSDGATRTQSVRPAGRRKPHVGYPASSAYTTAVGGTSIGY